MTQAAPMRHALGSPPHVFFKDAKNVMLSLILTSGPAGSGGADTLVPPLCALDRRTCISEENRTEKPVGTEGGAITVTMMHYTEYKNRYFWDLYSSNVLWAC